MARRIRFIPAGGLVEITSRTIQGRFLLQPTTHVADLCRGVLARAARLYPVEVHAFAFLSNHYHLLLTVPDAQRLAAFMNYLNSNLAREVGRAVRWRERFWGRRYQAIPVSNESGAQVGRLLYILRQGCKEGLVRRPADWPGATSVRNLLSGKPIRGSWHDRTSEFELSRRGKSYDARAFVSQEQLELTPLPCWKDSPSELRRAWVSGLIQAVENETADALREQKRSAIGSKNLAHQNPHDSPTPSKKAAAPLFHAASSRSRKAYRAAYRRFVFAFRRASESFRSSNGAVALLALFPPSSFPPPGPFLAVT